tara:strand:- start:54 stop:1082 length:1029 start_codon:yes stop_codon:yes gene_type:complete
MLKKFEKVAIYLEGHFSTDYGKMGLGVLRYLTNPIVAVIDSKNRGKNTNEFHSIERSVPIVSSIDLAISKGAEVLVLGIAPSGGKIPKSWFKIIEKAISKNLSIINGLHDTLLPKYKDSLNKNQWIWDVRVPQFIPQIASGKAAKLNNKRILCVGTDMAVGKMTTSLEIHKWSLKNKIKSTFIATGQIGITVSGTGIPLDAYKVDHACGAVETMVLRNSEYDWVFIEGQGSIINPGSTASLPLIRGSCVTHMILCHRADFKTLRDYKHIKIPDINKIIKLYEDLAFACGSYPNAKVLGISLNTSKLSVLEAQNSIDSLESLTNLPVTDVIRFGPEKLGLAIN